MLRAQGPLRRIACGIRERRDRLDQQMREEYAQIENPRFRHPDQRGPIANMIHRNVPNAILPEWVKSKNAPIFPRLRRGR